MTNLFYTKSLGFSSTTQTLRLNFSECDFSFSYTNTTLAWHNHSPIQLFALLSATFWGPEGMFKKKLSLSLKALCHKPWSPNHSSVKDHLSCFHLLSWRSGHTLPLALVSSDNRLCVGMVVSLFDHGLTSFPTALRLQPRHTRQSC